MHLRAQPCIEQPRFFPSPLPLQLSSWLLASVAQIEERAAKSWRRVLGADFVMRKLDGQVWNTLTLPHYDNHRERFLVQVMMMMPLACAPIPLSLLSLRTTLHPSPHVSFPFPLLALPSACRAARCTPLPGLLALGRRPIFSRTTTSKRWRTSPSTRSRSVTASMT